MKLVLINNAPQQISYLSGTIIVPANSSLDVSSSYWFSLYTDITFLKDIRENNITINDGLKTLEVSEYEKYLDYLINFDYNNKDTDGAIIVRTKAAKKGWSFWAVPIELTTSKLSGELYCKDSLGVDIPGITCKIYDGQGAQITTSGDDGVNLSGCEKTVMDFEPAFDFEMIGGALRIHNNPAEDVRLWVVGAPDIPAIYGGSKEFASGVNLKFLAPDSSFEIDGRVTKFVTYSPVTHSGKLRVILKHPAGLALNIQVLIHTYRL